ncbi:MAG TPA: OsmC family protein [Gemmatimonadales bacterium]|nr:OsmC family protein [Gemmatimonadales bacterium]
MQENSFALELTLHSGYAFTVDFGLEGVPDLTLDEPPPLGAGRGPNAARLLAAAVGNCLAASLLFCLRRARIHVKELRATVEGRLVRNERGRLRISEIHVKLAPEVAAEQRDQMGRCVELFEDYCVVTESVREGITVDVEVEAALVGAGVPMSTTRVVAGGPAAEDLLKRSSRLVTPGFIRAPRS